MQIQKSGYFLRIFLKEGEPKEKVIEKLREWGNNHSKIEIFPKVGVSDFITITYNDSIPLWKSVLEWKEIKNQVGKILEDFSRTVRNKKKGE